MWRTTVYLVWFSNSSPASLLSAFPKLTPPMPQKKKEKLGSRMPVT